MDDLKDRRGYSQLKEEPLDRTMWRNRFGGGFGPVVWQITDDDDDDDDDNLGIKSIIYALFFFTLSASISALALSCKNVFSKNTAYDIKLWASAQLFHYTR